MSLVPYILCFTNIRNIALVLLIPIAGTSPSSVNMAAANQQPKSKMTANQQPPSEATINDDKRQTSNVTPSVSN